MIKKLEEISKKENMSKIKFRTKKKTFTQDLKER